MFTMEDIEVAFKEAMDAAVSSCESLGKDMEQRVTALAVSFNVLIQRKTDQGFLPAEFRGIFFPLKVMPQPPCQCPDCGGDVAFFLTVHIPEELSDFIEDLPSRSEMVQC